jgi:TfoX/Sxy family transcriptional regulator of competence genes
VAYDESLAQRTREQLAAVPNVSERKMFGGWALLVDGNLCVGVIGDELIARVGSEAAQAALARPGTRPFDMTGRPMANWVMVAPGAVGGDDELAAWVDEALDFVRTLPPKG